VMVALSATLSRRCSSASFILAPTPARDEGKACPAGSSIDADSAELVRVLSQAVRARGPTAALAHPFTISPRALRGLPHAALARSKSSSCWDACHFSLALLRRVSLRGMGECSGDVRGVPRYVDDPPPFNGRTLTLEACTKLKNLAATLGLFARAMPVTPKLVSRRLSVRCIDNMSSFIRAKRKH
jgi:hypothetical protein